MHLIFYFLISCLSLILIIIIIYLIYKLERKPRANQKINNLFKEIVDEYKSANVKFTKIKDKCYDYYLETLTSIYYIKIIYNYECYEISLNSRYLWQYKKDVNDEKIRFIPDVIDFVNFNPTDEKKAVYKMCLIYPNSRSLLIYLNESELAFVRPEQQIYGIHFITYERLNSNHSYIEGR